MGPSSSEGTVRKKGQENKYNNDNNDFRLKITY